MHRLKNRDASACISDDHAESAAAGTCRIRGARRHQGNRSGIPSFPADCRRRNGLDDGDNSTGALGNGTTDKAFRPVPVTKFDGTPLGNAKFVTGGGYFSVALLNDGTVWAWGREPTGSSATVHRPISIVPCR